MVGGRNIISGAVVTIRAVCLRDATNNVAHGVLADTVALAAGRALCSATSNGAGSKDNLTAVSTGVAGLAGAGEGVDAVNTGTAVGTSSSRNRSTVINVGLAGGTTVSRLAGAGVPGISNGEGVVGADAAILARVGCAVVDGDLALVASETVGAVTMERSRISRGNIGSNAGRLQTAR